jgi:hypothetical protein
MPADLVPNAAIPGLAARVDSPALLRVLRHIQKAGFILNGRQVDEETASALGRLTGLGLVDPGYEGAVSGRPDLWVSNGNGSRVLSYLTGIRAAPHYEILSSDLAAWIEQLGEDRWWNVDGDPLLTGRMPFPCPADELAAELRRIARPLLVQAKSEDADAKGQPTSKEKLDALVDRSLGGARLLYLCWEDSPFDWLLSEDLATTEQSKADAAAQVK